MERKDDEHQKQQGRSEQDKQQGRPEQGFIPGLPNDIVLENIATKIVWSSVLALTCVNRTWRKAIHSREVYNVRRRCGASQSMVVVPVEDAPGLRRGFYDVESQDLWLFPEFRLSCFETRLFPVLHQANTLSDNVHNARELTFLDGRLYAMWERVSLAEPIATYEQEVLVLDIGACHRAWNFCSSTMSDSPVEFWAACNGKIYSFHTCQRCFHGKVFDPKNHKWMEIKDRSVNVCHPRSFAYPPRNFDYHGRVTVLKTRIYVANTWSEDIMVFDSVTEKWHVIPNTLVTPVNTINLSTSTSSTILMEEKMANFSNMSMIVIEGKIYNISSSGVEQYNLKSNYWIELQRTVHKDVIEVKAVAFNGSEAIAMLKFNVRGGSGFQGGVIGRLCKSVNFGVEGKPLTWEEFAEFPPAGGRCLDRYNVRDLQFGNLEL